MQPRDKITMEVPSQRLTPLSSHTSPTNCCGSCAHRAEQLSPRVPSLFTRPQTADPCSLLRPEDIHAQCAGSLHEASSGSSTEWFGQGHCGSRHSARLGRESVSSAWPALRKGLSLALHIPNPWGVAQIRGSEPRSLKLEVRAGTPPCLDMRVIPS